MDALERHDVERSRTTPLQTKLAQALDMMAAGLRLKQAQLKREHPAALQEERERMFTDWLRRDE